MCKILGLFLHKYSLLNRENLTQPNTKTKNLSVLFCILKSRSKFEDFEKKMTLIAYVFPKLRIAKDMVREMSKKSRFKRPFDKQHGKRSQTLLKSPWQHLYHIYWSLYTILSWKKWLLVICKILGLFVNTLTVDDRYSVLKSVNLTKPIQMQLPQK